MKRLLIVGFGRAGKDTSAMMLSEITKLPYLGSTSWAAKEFVADELDVHPMQAWEERHQHREKWKEICDKRREADQTFLIRWAFGPYNCGILAGVRDEKELLAARKEKIFDYVLWIHRPGTPVDPTVTFEPEDCDEIIVNDGTLIKLHSTLFLWAERHGLIPALYLGRPPTIDRYRE